MATHYSDEDLTSRALSPVLVWHALEDLGPELGEVFQERRVVEGLHATGIALLVHPFNRQSKSSQRLPAAVLITAGRVSQLRKCYMEMAQLTRSKSLP